MSEGGCMFPFLLTCGTILFMNKIRQSERSGAGVRKEGGSQRDPQTLETNEMSGPTHAHKRR